MNKNSLLCLLAATLLTAVTVWFGWWQVTFLVGALLALFPAVRRPVRLAMLAGFLGWGLPLLMQSFSGQILSMAELLGAILGIGGTAGTGVALLLPSIVGALLALCGAWIVSAVKQVLPVKATQPVERKQTA